MVNVDNIKLNKLIDKFEEHIKEQDKVLKRIEENLDSIKFDREYVLVKEKWYYNLD